MSEATATSTVDTSSVAAPKPVWAEFKLKSLDVLRPEIAPYNFQQFAVYKSLMQNRFVFGLATGLGKTLCSYLTYHYFRTKFSNTRMIIVTTKSALLQFQSEHTKFFDHDARIVAVHEDMPRFGAKSYANARKNAYEFFASPHDLNKIDVLVLNYAVFRIDHAEILKSVKKLNEQQIPLFFIADEATAFKNIGTKTHHAVAAVAKRATKALGLTATLTKGKLEEIYGIFKGIGVQITSNKDEFMDRYCITFAPPGRPHFKSVVGYKNVGEFIDRVRPYCIVLRKADVAEYLPPYTIRKIYLEHEDEQFALIRDIYSGVVNPALFGSDEDDVGDVSPANATAVDPTQVFGERAAEETLDMGGVQMIQRLTEVGFIKRALMDPRLVFKKDLNKFDRKSPKTEELLRLLSDEFTDEKIVVYTPSKQYLKLMMSTVRREKGLADYYRNPLEISGDISGALREEYKQTFQEKDTHRLIFINDAGLEAINLQSASILVVTSLPRTGGDLVQLAGRLSRLGSTHANLQIIYLLTKNSQDEDEYLITQQQMQIMSLVLGEAEVGLLDWDHLRSAEAARTPGEDDISPEELKTRSLARLLLHKRKKRASHYRHAHA